MPDSTNPSKSPTNIQPNGFTLIELLIGLSLLACLLLFSLQGYQYIKALFESHAVFTQLTNLINYARSEAIRTGNQVIICKSHDRKTCSGQWSDGQIALINPQNPHVLIALGPVKTGTLSFRAFQSSDFLRFTPKGNTFEQNGTFIYCPNKNPRLAHALIIEKSGQTKISQDIEGVVCGCFVGK